MAHASECVTQHLRIVRSTDPGVDANSLWTGRLGFSHAKLTQRPEKGTKGPCVSAKPRNGLARPSRNREPTTPWFS
jgi:hypothetical protein